MTDEEHAAMVRSTVDRLNDAVQTAVEAGLSVEVTYSGIRYLRVGEVPVISVAIRRPL